MSNDKKNQPELESQLSAPVATSEQQAAIETVLNECMARISDVCEEQFGGGRPIILAVNLTGMPQNGQYTRATNLMPPGDALMLRELWEISNANRTVVENDRGRIERI